MIEKAKIDRLCSATRELEDAINALEVQGRLSLELEREDVTRIGDPGQRWHYRILLTFQSIFTSD